MASVKWTGLSRLTSSSKTWRKRVVYSRSLSSMCRICGLPEGRLIDTM